MYIFIHTHMHTYIHPFKCDIAFQPLICTLSRSFRYLQIFSSSQYTRIIYFLFELLAYSQKGSLVAQTVKNLPAMQETWVQSLGQEDPLEKRMAIHSSILAWRIPWTEEPGRIQTMGTD